MTAPRNYHEVLRLLCTSNRARRRTLTRLWWVEHKRLHLALRVQLITTRAIRRRRLGLLRRWKRLHGVLS